MRHAARWRCCRRASDEELPEIARKLHISHVTVRNHVQHILTRLGVHSTLEAIAVALIDGHAE